MTVKKHWIDKSDAARGIKENFGTENALKYLIGEKFLAFLDAGESNKAYQAEIPSFAAEIKEIFEQWEIADYLERARHREPFDPSDYKDEGDMDADDIEMERKRHPRSSPRSDARGTGARMASGGAVSGSRNSSCCHFA